MSDRKNIPMTLDEVKSMAKSCQLAARTLEHVAPFIKPGITTLEIDQIIHDFILRNNATPATLGYFGYPKSCCTSINEVVCHGVPGPTVVKDGDIINVDVTTIVDGFYGDTSRTFLVGNVSEKAKKITQCAEQAMYKGIEAIVPKGFTGDIGFETNKYVTRSGFHTVKEIGGHGVGRKFHLDPFVPAWGKKGRGELLQPYTCITVEPMINEGTDQIVEYDIPGSSIKYYVTSDRSLSAQFEHTVLITETGYEILTVP
jgi:methionyl aminopeptidase